MKKFAVFLAFLFLSTGLFATDYNSYRILDVNTDNIYEIFDELEEGEDYSINFPEDFDFSKLDEEFFQYRMIEKLHDLCVAGSRLKFSGPFDYIYFDGYRSVNNFSVIKTQIIEHPEKYYCVDISESSYDTDSYGEYIPLPTNCFAGHDNLYWVYFGKFLGEDIPNGVCSNLKNLQAVFFWDEGNINSGAFNNSNPNTLYVCGECGLVLPLSEYVYDYNYSDYDYLKFTSAYDYDPYSGVSWLVDGDEDCYYGWWEQDWSEDGEIIGTTVPSYNDDDSAEDYNSFPLIEDDEDISDEEYLFDEDLFDEEYISDEEYIELFNILTEPLLEDFTWDLLGEYTEITKDTKTVNNPVELEDVATAFIVSYINGDEDYKKYAIVSEEGTVEEEGLQLGINTIKDYGDLKKIILLNQISETFYEDDNSAIVCFGIEYESNGKLEKEVTILEMENLNGSWKVTKVNNSYLRGLLFILLYFFDYY